MDACAHGRRAWRHRLGSAVEGGGGGVASPRGRTAGHPPRRRAAHRRGVAHGGWCPHRHSTTGVGGRRGSDRRRTLPRRLPVPRHACRGGGVPRWLPPPRSAVGAGGARATLCDAPASATPTSQTVSQLGVSAACRGRRDDGRPGETRGGWWLPARPRLTAAPRPRRGPCAAGTALRWGPSGCPPFLWGAPRLVCRGGLFYQDVRQTATDPATRHGVKRRRPHAEWGRRAHGSPGGTRTGASEEAHQERGMSSRHGKGAPG